ncbi:MAG: aminotransferase class V-fold PLP-dependent enzyme, partial [Candidatus Kariarchaeaceae archaeon]
MIDLTRSNLITKILNFGGSLRHINNLKDEMMVDPEITYVNHASIGPLPRATHDIVTRGFSTQARIGERKIDYGEIDELWESITTNTARMLHGNPSGVAITNNTAMGFHIVADGLFSHFSQGSSLKGSNVVIPEIEFVTNSYVWQQLAQRFNIEFRTVPTIDGRLPPEAFEPYIDDRTLLVSLSFVQFSNGFRADLRGISELAHNHGAHVVVDAIQGLGAVPLDVKRTDVDFVAAAGYKWLLGPLGSGIFYGKPELVQDMESLLVGWFSSTN